MNIIDKALEIVRPDIALKRARDRLMIDQIRDYQAAKPTRLSNGYSRKGSKAADEAGRAHSRIAGGSQDLVRNTALGNRIKAVIASNIVGAGIRPDYIGKNSRRVEAYKNTFDGWAESTACDYENHNNLWGLQHLWAATVVESGGCLVRQVVNNALAFPLVLQTLEQQYLDESKSGVTDPNREIINGIEFNEDGSVHGYWIKTSLRSTYRVENSKFYPADEIIHFYWKDRPGQHLGVGWMHSVSDLINQRQEWRDTVLTQMRLAACFGLIVEEAPKDMGLGDSERGIRDEDGNVFSEVEAGMIGYTDKGSNVTTVSPPNINQTTDFSSSVVEDIAAGVGITREQITGNFSGVTWASGRLARGEFYTNLDRWQHFMMIPGLNKVHDWFDNIYTLKKGKVNIVKRSWIIPQRSAVNPKEELEVDIRKVRSAAMTPQQFTRKHGVKFSDAIQAWKDAKTEMGDLPFDFDPSKFSAAGNQLDDNDSASSNASSNTEKDDKTDNKE